MALLQSEQKARALEIIKLLKNATKGMVEPAATQVITDYGRNPFLILISCLLSLRTKDIVSLPAYRRLFEYARTPQMLISLSVERIAEIIYPVGFYKKRALQLHVVCQQLLNQFNGVVPKTMQELLLLHGVGRKTANLVLGLGFKIPALCVDTHVHRISNRLGLVITKTPQETEKALKQVVPKQYWIEYNRLLVMWGQNVCVPLSPFCSRCPLFTLCKKVGVPRSR